MPKSGLVESSLSDEELLQYVEDIDHPEVSELMERLRRALEAVQEAEMNESEAVGQATQVELDDMEKKLKSKPDRGGGMIRFPLAHETVAVRIITRTANPISNVISCSVALA